MRLVIVRLMNLLKEQLVDGNVLMLMRLLMKLQESSVHMEMY